MFVASAGPEEEHKPEKHELRPHDSIVAGITRKTGKCAVRDTRTKGQVKTARMASGKRAVFSVREYRARKILSTTRFHVHFSGWAGRHARRRKRRKFSLC